MAVTTYQLPQRFELVNELDSFDAGVRLIPYGAAFPVGSMISANLSSKLRVPGLYLSIVGSGFQVIGYALLSTLDSSVHITPGTYGYEVLCGLGCGMTYQMMYLMVPFTVGVRDKAVGMGAANQFRWMGSAFGLAIATAVFNGYTSSRLEALGVPGLASDYIAGNQGALPESLQSSVRDVLSGGYNRQMIVLCAFSAAEIPVTFLLWKTPQIVAA
jgi:hypothetical protein